MIPARTPRPVGQVISDPAPVAVERSLGAGLADTGGQPARDMPPREWNPVGRGRPPPSRRGCGAVQLTAGWAKSSYGGGGTYARFTRSLPLHWPAGGGGEVDRRRRRRTEIFSPTRDADIRCDSSSPSPWIGDRLREISLLDRIGAFRAGTYENGKDLDRPDLSCFLRSNSICLEDYF